MNNNDFRAIGIGAMVGAAVFGGLLLWVDHDPWGMVTKRLALAKLTPEERAELKRLAAEQQETDRKFQEMRASDTEEVERGFGAVAAGFAPYLLTTAPAVASAADLALANLVAEIVHCEERLRDGTIASPDRHTHLAALNLEWSRRSGIARYALPRVERLRLDIAAARIKAARYAPWPTPPEPVVMPAEPFGPGWESDPWAANPTLADPIVSDGDEIGRW